MEITKFEECTGCSLCAFSCPTQAIKTHLDDDATFWYAKVDEDKCILCNRCISICPANIEEQKFLTQKKCFIAQEINPFELKTSTSGGIASALAKQFCKNGGVVYGAAFASGMKLEHIRCVDENDCEKIKGSKYVQSDILHAFSQIECDLKRSIPVLFIGTPCQCAAMKNAFDKYSYFFCCDFICNGVGSPLIFKRHIEWLEKIYHCDINNYFFRPKVKKYLEPYECFLDTKGKYHRVKAPWKKWGTIYYSALVLRSSCFACKYSRESRIGNFTFSDIPLELTHQLELPLDIMKYGASLISINDTKGMILLEKINNKVYLSETERHLLDYNKHTLHDIQKKNNFCRDASGSLKQAKNRYLGQKMKIKSILIEIIDCFFSNDK